MVVCVYVDNVGVFTKYYSREYTIRYCLVILPVFTDKTGLFLFHFFALKFDFEYL